MEAFAIKLTGSDLASRQTAAAERQRLLAQSVSGDRIAVDLSQVETVSYSYADELFGVLVAVKGWEWFVQTISLVNANEHILRVIADVINRRLKETRQSLECNV